MIIKKNLHHCLSSCCLKSSMNLNHVDPWWRHQMETFSALLVTGHLCGEFTGPRWIPAQRPVTRSFDVFFDLHPNKRLSKQWWGWWFDTPSYPLCRHRNALTHKQLETHACLLCTKVPGHQHLQCLLNINCVGQFHAEIITVKGENIILVNIITFWRKKYQFLTGKYDDVLTQESNQIKF